MSVHTVSPFHVFLSSNHGVEACMSVHTVRAKVSIKRMFQHVEACMSVHTVRVLHRLHHPGKFSGSLYVGAYCESCNIFVGIIIEVKVCMLVRICKLLVGTCLNFGRAQR